MAGWTSASVPDLSGMTVLVTGANSGIGYEAARVFARKGAQVVLACRDRTRGEKAAARIGAETPAASIEVLPLDLAKLSSVRDAAKRFGDTHERLDILCNNAGVMAIPRAVTEDGFEMQLGVNHFGHFALTGLLLGRLLSAPAARVVTVSSMAHRMGRMRLDDLAVAVGYETWAAYGQSKLANLLFAYELQRRFESKHSSAISVACHPGYADTNLQQVGPALRGSVVGGVLFRASNALFAQSAKKGAWPTLYAATSTKVQGGDYIGPGGLNGIMGTPDKARSNRLSHDHELAASLWNVSVERTGVDFGALR